VFAEGGRLLLVRAAPSLFTDELRFAPDPAQLGRSEREREVEAELLVCLF
jgi:hypothetical protein